MGGTQASRSAGKRARQEPSSPEAQSVAASYDQGALLPFQSFIDHLSIGIAWFGPNEEMIACNRCYRDLLDLPDALFQGKLPSLGDVVQFNAKRGEYHDPDQLRLMEDFAARAKTLPLTLERTRPNGAVLEVRSTPFPDGGFMTVTTDVTTRSQTLKNLGESEQRFRLLFDASPDPTWIIEDNQFIECNQAAVRILGYASMEEFLYVHPSKLSPEFQPDGEPSFAKAERMMALAREKGVHRFEWIHLRADGSPFTAEVTLSDMELQGRTAIHCVWRDISARKHAEEALLASEQRFRDFTFSIADWIWETDVKGRFTFVSGNIEEILGFTAEEVVGRYSLELMPPEEAQRVRPILKEITAKREAFADLRNINRHKDGSLRHVSTSGIPLFNEKNELTGFRGVDKDVTAIQEKDDKILKLAYHDMLTGLPNRTLLEDRVSQALLTIARTGGKFAILFLDLDRFKVVNDSLGHDVGDKLLVDMKDRIQGNIRKSDTLARLGGDEFVVMLSDVEQVDEIAFVAEKIIAEVSKPVVLNGHEFRLGVSIGAVVAPDDGVSFHTLLKNADTAMYRAKEEGRSTLRFFDSSMNARIMGRLKMEDELRHAIERGEIELHYQPKIGLPLPKLIGAEALCRWRRNGELVPPCDFIPIAEETGLILPLGDLVLVKALSQITSWRAQGFLVPRIAVNLSARQFGDGELIDRILRLVSEHGLSSQDIEFELTESLMLTNPARAEVALNRLNGEGFTITVDDFGTGFSSLSYLKRLPIRGLKIDRSFIQDIGVEQRDEALVGTILAIGRTLDIDVVAEGVETEAQLCYLMEHQCAQFQGYHFAKPLPADEFKGWLERVTPL